MQKLVTGILAHVDAGKTTLSEAMLYTAGSLRKMGRVDNGDAFLDTYDLERARGITIFSKQAVFELGEVEINLLDTPGHVDFAGEMERSLQVLDYAVLVISGADGVQAHTRTVWRLLKKYGIPVFVFVNKMDQNGTDRVKLLKELKEQLDENCLDFGEEGSPGFAENAALCEESVLEYFLKNGKVETRHICRLISERKIFPCYFGSALKLQGVEALLQGMEKYTCRKAYPETFGARVFKILRDDQGSRLTYMKITGGSLKVRMPVGEEKVNQIRVYSGEKYETAEEMTAGGICAVTGLSGTYPGQGLGREEAVLRPVLEPVLTYRIHLPGDCDARTILPRLKELEEEDPLLNFIWEEQLQEIQVQLMGEVQKEILQSLIKERFQTEVSFDEGSVVYKETIAAPVEGVGHFEPLRHYAEVHLLLEPAAPGSGLVFGADVSEEMLDRNWQRLVLTHLKEKEHKGVLTGSPITDMKITLSAGRAHQKHTEGGDFRQATYRALRQGLKKAESVLLEPYYDFLLEIPRNMTGRAMTDMELRGAVMEAPWVEGEAAVLKGSVPAAAVRGYQKEVLAYTRGEGRFHCAYKGYGRCRNAEEIIEKSGYDSERDLENPTGSVFCAHGAGFTVSWDRVEEYMHVDSSLPQEEKEQERERLWGGIRRTEERTIGTEEVEHILSRTYYANRKEERNSPGWKKSKNRESSIPPAVRSFREPDHREEYLLVDGYNIIFAWEELKRTAEDNIDGARGMLMDILCNYQAIRECSVILVFDAYRVQGHETEMFPYHNIHVVYTKEAETADRYIERFAHENSRKYRVTVATSDGLEQIIIRGQGCGLLSARELQEEIKRVNEKLQEDYAGKGTGNKNYLLDSLPEETAAHIKESIRAEKNNRKDVM